jgi:hypothetical protein
VDVPIRKGCFRPALTQGRLRSLHRRHFGLSEEHFKCFSLHSTQGSLRKDIVSLLGPASAAVVWPVRL